MNVFIDHCSLCYFEWGSKSLQKPTGQLLTANLYELYTTYLVNILFATLSIMNLKMQECNHHIIAFHSKINVFKVGLKLWHLYQT